MNTKEWLRQLVMFGVLMAASRGSAGSYYVAMNGSDTNPGTQQAPWRTIVYAMEKTASGDTVFVRSGSYPEGELFINAEDGQGGAPGKMWTLKGYRNERPALNINVKVYAGYVRIQGFRFEGGGVFVRFDHPGHCEILNNHFVGEFGYGAVEAGGDSNLIAGNYIEIDSAVTSTLDHGIYIHGGIGSIIRNNVVKNSSGYGIHLYDERGYDLQDIIVENNQVYGSRLRSGIIVALGGNSRARNITIRNNVVVHNEVDGIAVRDAAQNVKIYNNTIYGVGQNGIYFKYDVDNVIVRNNIIHLGAGREHIYNNNNAPGIIVDHNLYWPAPLKITDVVAANPLIANPLFVNETQFNFKLKSNSPAIDAGVDVGLPYSGNLPDIGAEEFDGSTAGVGSSEAGSPQSFVLHQNFPNPFNPETTITYHLPVAAAVTLAIYDLQGREVRRLVDVTQASGEHQARWDGKNQMGETVAGGVYICRLTARKTGSENVLKESTRMLLLR
ncbi:MAG: right-handed parallel beta-helix repeat-containing protein [bacterium]